LAHSRSAEKRIRQNEKNRLRNRADRSRLRSDMKRLRKVLADKDPAKARELLPRTASLIDRMIKKGVIHENTGSRYKSRLAKLMTSATT
jgi:small subunit ribosomal protein S20